MLAINWSSVSSHWQQLWKPCNTCSVPCEWKSCERRDHLVNRAPYILGISTINFQFKLYSQSYSRENQVIKCSDDTPTNKICRTPLADQNKITSRTNRRIVNEGEEKHVCCLELLIGYDAGESFCIFGTKIWNWEVSVYMILWICCCRVSEHSMESTQVLYLAK